MNYLKNKTNNLKPKNIKQMKKYLKAGLITAAIVVTFLVFASKAMDDPEKTLWIVLGFLVSAFTVLIFKLVEEYYC